MSRQVALVLALLLASPAVAQQGVNPIHPLFAPLDAAGRKVRTAEEMDAAKTCGACHDAAYIAAHTDHKAPRSAATCATELMRAITGPQGSCDTAPRSSARWPRPAPHFPVRTASP